MNGLAEHLRRLIAIDGPLPVSRFMAEALGHPQHGYYMRRDPLGAAGDFVTAPEVSQMFGELLGLWCAETWRQMGAPSRLLLAELGPGRGTLMADALRAARLLPAFAAAIEVHLVELSPALRAAQAERLDGHDISWHDRIESLPRGPSLVIANEFFDALPVRQFQRGAAGWYERLVTAADDDFTFVLAPDPVPEALLPAAPRSAPVGDTVEVAPAREAVLGALAARLVEDGGAMLIVDYGYDGGHGDTLQAVRRHAFADALTAPGSADLTAHVDFAALRRAAESAGARAWGPVEQGVFLTRLGIDARAARLAAAATAEAACAVNEARERLLSPEAMGRLFKAFAVTAPGLPAPAGFEAPA
jgi:NADH dehydrogenase [ubiquinone] 1 alpha subcomplex assembly factor 7